MNPSPIQQRIASAVQTGLNFYAVLGVPRHADLKTIKSTYRKLARQTHPDHNPDDPAKEDQFKRISEAYEVLGTSENRMFYDQLRLLVTVTGTAPRRPPTPSPRPKSNPIRRAQGYLRELVDELDGRGIVDAWDMWTRSSASKPPTQRQIDTLERLWVDFSRLGERLGEDHWRALRYLYANRRHICRAAASDLITVAGQIANRLRTSHLSPFEGLQTRAPIFRKRRRAP